MKLLQIRYKGLSLWSNCPDRETYEFWKNLEDKEGTLKNRFPYEGRIIEDDNQSYYTIPQIKFLDHGKERSITEIC